MARHRTRDSANETPFSRRFCMLMDSHRPKMTQEEFGRILGVSKSSIGFYRDGTNQPNYSILLKIADFFGCSTDYLLGRTDYRGADPQLRMICDYTGLRESAVAELRRLLTDQRDDDLTRQRRRVAFSTFVESIDFADLLDSAQSAYEISSGILAAEKDAPKLDGSLPYDQLQEEARKARQDLDTLQFAAYKGAKQWEHFYGGITAVNEATSLLEGKLTQIHDRFRKAAEDSEGHQSE